MLRIILLLAISTSAVAGMYKWTDTEGQVHYSDKRIEQDAETLDIQDTHIGTKGLRAGEKQLLRKIERQQRNHPPAAGKQQKIGSSYDQRVCRFYQEEIDDIKDELRRGYSVQRGEYLKARMQRTRVRVKEHCK